MELDPQVCPEEIMSREVELGNSSATDIVLVTLSKHSINCAVHKSLGNGEGTPP